MVDPRNVGIKSESEMAKPKPVAAATIREKLMETIDKIPKDQTSQIVIILFGAIVLSIVCVCIFLDHMDGCTKIYNENETWL